MRTFYSDQRKAREKAFIDLQKLSLERAHHDVVNSAAFEQLLRIDRSRIDAPDFGLASFVRKAVRPQVARVTHERPSSREKHGMIVGGSVQEQRTGRNSVTNDVRKGNPFSSEHAVL